MVRKHVKSISRGVPMNTKRILGALVALFAILTDYDIKPSVSTAAF